MIPIMTYDPSPANPSPGTVLSLHVVFLGMSSLHTLTLVLKVSLCLKNRIILVDIVGGKNVFYSVICFSHGTFFFLKVVEVERKCLKIDFDHVG